MALLDNIKVGDTVRLRGGYTLVVGDISASFGKTYKIITFKGKLRHSNPWANCYKVTYHRDGRYLRPLDKYPEGFESDIVSIGLLKRSNKNGYLQLMGSLSLDSV